MSETESRRFSQDSLILAVLVRGGSYEEAAEAAGISARSVRRRMADDAFAGEVRRQRADRASRLSATLLDSGSGAVRVLAEALEDESAGTRLKAAQVILTLGQRYRREVEMTDRIETLERRLDSIGDSSLGEDEGS